MSMPMSQEAWDEMEAERTAWPMTVSDEHHYWHAINGPGNCPWDAASCQPPEPDQCPYCGDYLDYDGKVRCTKEECVAALRADEVRWAAEDAESRMRQEQIDATDPWAMDPPF